MYSLSTIHVANTLSVSVMIAQFVKNLPPQMGNVVAMMNGTPLARVSRECRALVQLLCSRSSSSLARRSDDDVDAADPEHSSETCAQVIPMTQCNQCLISNRDINDRTVLYYSTAVLLYVLM
jgi:hypothetical protein